jgi:2-keto-4-pentenoate hydratase/2-oxohepta-3-ene-1,7-dioic acid hydratase in catechol pathway
VNGQERQNGSTADMLFPVDVLVAYLSTIFTLEPGDLIFTGTPEGVGQVVTGDLLEAYLESVGTLMVGVR